MAALRAGFLAQNLYRTHFSKVSRFNYLYAALFHSSPPLNAEGMPLKMPSLSPTMMEGTIVKWLKKEGDPIQPGDALCDIQTDKAVVTMDTEEEGILAKILVPEDTKDVKVGTLIAVLAPEGEDWKTIEIPAGEESAASATTAEDTPAAAAAGGGHAHGNYGPSVRLLLEQYGLAAEQVPPGGPHGILLKGDVLKYIKEKSLQPLPVSAVPPPEVPKPAVAAAPVAPAPTPAVPAPPPTIGVSEDGYEDIEVTSMRRTIAKRLTQSKSGIAHSYGTLECQSDKLLALRKQYKNEGINVSVNDLIIKAVSVALTKCPEMNCVWQGDQLTYASQVDMSIAVATPTGLITPIVRGADFLGIEEIASQVRDLAARARENKLKLDEFQGGTFTISNLGMFGISEFSAIINPPQCGILAVGSGIVKIDENGSPVTCMRATLSYDRAGVDDDTAAAFLEELKNILENPVTMMVGGYKSQVDHPLAALL
ncbi:pyruvate dehydrogenase protein X component isoform X2 [Penaeus vannamei]|uniref:Dihydrolipoamide acetyltransferase component of pyruvate dehydrogenase complex n=1 Tax=Penaeus vannamei TaxID=6689 RepID=A0A3R7SYK3_PENVA|nr:pyruvate dehydrogenase protein X component-like isoform X2 [Penaeus vannamei]ROT81636.1 hypothetical protein C7M84_025216 [Penaeus vannamei]